MKCYIAFCYSEGVGGGQNYLNSKTGWLERKGWTPIIFTATSDFRILKFKQKEIPWGNLRRFSQLRSMFLAMSPGFWPKWIVKNELARMISVINRNFEEIIIESGTDYWAEWGEMLARQLGAKNFCYLTDELLERYGAKEFLYFKFLRHEVAGIHQTSMHRLFSGYKEVAVSDECVLTAGIDSSVAEIASEAVLKVKRCDFNIAYMGRHKQYMENIVAGLIDFAVQNREKSINFIILGEIRESTIKKFCIPSNITITRLGYMTPIPKMFFEKVDVVIAGSGCAYLSARENVPVIVADAKTLMSCGILGYTTQSCLFSKDKPKSFAESLNDVLILQVHKNMEFSLSSFKDADNAYENHLEYINRSSKEKVYFDFEKYPQRKHENLRGIKWIIKFNILHVYGIICSFLKFLKKKNN